MGHCAVENACSRDRLRSEVTELYRIQTIHLTEYSQTLFQNDHACFHNPPTA